MKHRVKGSGSGSYSGAGGREGGGRGGEGWATRTHFFDHVKRPVGEASLARVGVGARRDAAVREEHDKDAAAVRLVGAKTAVVVGQRAVSRRRGSPLLGLALGKVGAHVP